MINTVVNNTNLKAILGVLRLLIGLVLIISSCQKTPINGKENEILFYQDSSALPSYIPEDLFFQRTTANGLIDTVHLHITNNDTSISTDIKALNKEFFKKIAIEYENWDLLFKLAITDDQRYKDTLLYSIEDLTNNWKMNLQLNAKTTSEQIFELKKKDRIEVFKINYDPQSGLMHLENHLGITLKRILL